MEEDKYQISTKAKYINLLLLEDELRYLDELLASPLSSTESLIKKFRATRYIFLTLNNVKDSLNKIQIDGTKDFIDSTRELRKELMFANHFRNRGIGHLNNTLLQRAVQWHPQIFNESTKEHEEFRVIEAHRAIIESCINSFIDNEGIQKVFGHEIDLFYPENADEFYDYLYGVVHKAIGWVTIAKNEVYSSISLHTEEDFFEISSIAGSTSFNLKDEADFSYSEEESKVKIQKTIQALEEIGAEERILELVKSICKI